MRRRRTDLRSLLDECFADFQVRCQAASQILELQVPDDLPPVLCDHTKISQVLFNLMGNAQKYTPEGGKIWLRVVLQEGYVRIEVQDNGMGINLRNQSHIFEAFTQLDRPEGPGAKGTGLGLTISRHIVQLHGGEIGLESELGKGSRFYFTVPLHQEEEELQVFIEDHLKLSRGRGKPLSLVLIRCRDGQGENPPAHLACLRKVQQAADSTFRDYRDESLLTEKERLLFLLLETDKAGSRVLLQRISRMLPPRLEGIDRLEFRVGEFLDSSPREMLATLKKENFLPWIGGEDSLWRRKVLVIDDEIQVLQMIAELLPHSHLPLEVQTTASGYEGCIRYGEFEPDLVILDVVMPEIDGREVLKSMRQGNRALSTRFLIISGYSDHREEMLALGGDDFLMKPFSISELLEKVETLLSR